jgi:hypothetical protein
MGIFVYEIDGVRIAAYGDIDRSRAEAWANEEAFKIDLDCREYNERPIWNGESEVHVREATPPEITKWKESRDRARENGSIDHDDKEWLAFLVPTTHATDENDDEEWADK